ncbi:MAG: amidase family protein [Oscillochloridaceae bacterium]|nr:amidase family protein [Chloroflexaceae bacterium]MDW8389544.1 amidase family protein [Oscillochloridaceae bacterium]
MSEEWCFSPARELAAAIRARQVTCVEVLQAHLRRIERLNPLVNAIVTLTAEQAMAVARSYDAALADGTAPSPAAAPLYGLPVAHKDLLDTRGVRTTYGSPIFANHAPDADALIVARLKAAGAITLGKTNTPEFGAGSQTFNPVFGATRNPYDLGMTCGGSSGGAAVALACGFIALADGSDMGGSLRNPASFCNVVGLRPTPGRVPVWPNRAPYLPLTVEGPMARTVGDVALMLAAIAGTDPRDPLSFEEVSHIFAQPLDYDLRGARVAWSSPRRARCSASALRGARVAWSPDLGGLPVDPRVTAVVESQRATFATLGCIVEEATPDLRDADEIFLTLRALSFELNLGELLDAHGDQLKDTVIWNIEQGRRLTGSQVARAMRLHGELLARVRAFFERYDYLVLPVSQVPPFPVEQPYVTSINGVAMGSYLEWMRSCYWISATGAPALAVPAGFTPEGLPVGLQIVARPRNELGLLRLGHAFEHATGFWRRRPRI